MTIKYLLTAGRAIQDQLTSKWSYVDVFNVVVIPKTLTQIVSAFVIGGRLSGVLAGTPVVDFYIMAPNGSIFHKVSISGVVTTGDVDFVANVPFVTFTVPGRYYLHVAYNGAIIADENRFYLDVVKEP